MNTGIVFIIGQTENCLEKQSDILDECASLIEERYDTLSTCSYLITRMQGKNVT
jgi:hypothetical protein